MMRSKIIIIIFNILFGICLLPALFLAILSIMLLDSPGSGSSIFTLLLLLGVWSFPLLIIGSLVFSWVFYRSKKYVAAVLVSMSPLLSVILSAVCFFLINIVCQGKFAC